MAASRTIPSLVVVFVVLIGSVYGQYCTSTAGATPAPTVTLGCFDTALILTRNDLPDTWLSLGQHGGCVATTGLVCGMLYCQEKCKFTTDPAFPSLPNTFQTRVEATIADKLYTVSAEEYFDGVNNRASLTMYRDGAQYSLIFDYANDQLFYVYPDQTCKVTNLTTDTNNILFGDTSSGGKMHVFTTTGVLKFSQQYGQIYKGKATIHGVSCDRWQSCMTWSQLNSTFTVDYYFTVQNWVNPAGWPQIPVRAEVNGQQTRGDGSVATIHHYYDYSNFRVEIDATSSVFETPSGVVCPGRKQTRAVPNLKGAYIYREEIVAPINNAVTEADVWYDDLYKLVRYDFRPPPNTPPYYNTDAVSEVHDFNTGVAYAMDKTMGNCTIIPITNTSFDASINVTKSIQGKPTFVLQMKTPGQLFYLDGNYSFEGQRIARDMVCDVFIAKKNDFELGGMIFNATFQFFFLAKNFKEQNDEGNIDQSDTDVPIRLDINVAGIQYSARYNFYDFSQEHSEISVFDISTCYSQTDQIPFKITFTGTFDKSVMVYREIFLFQTISSISQFSGASPLRVQKADFQMQDDQAYFVGVLLERAPPIARYRKISGMVLQYRNDKTVNGIAQASDCADLCNSNTNFTCNSFDYCAGTRVCSLSKSHTEDGTLVSTSGQCDHYSRTLGGYSAREIDLQTAWLNLRNNVVRGIFSISIKYDIKTTQYFATDISSQVSVGGSRQPSAATTLKQFQAMVNKYVPGFDDDIFTGISVDDCAAACMDAETYICNSFEYQWGTGYCYLSHFHPDNDPKSIKNTNGVDLYIRDYTARFAILPGTTVLSNSPVVYQSVYSANQCAKLCVDLHEFSCKSFDYCDNIGTCFLGKKHVLDVPKSGIKQTPQCDHYSRNYIDDFQYNQRKLMKMTNDRVISGLTVMQCAKACVDEETFSCSSFAYCGNYTECRLSSSALNGIGQTTIQTNAYCDEYSRQYFPDGTAYIANPSKYLQTTAAPSKTYSSGSMAGIGIGMLIVGLILMVAIIAAYLKFTNRTLDDMSISFKKMDESDS